MTFRKKLVFQKTILDSVREKFEEQCAPRISARIKTISISVTFRSFFIAKMQEASLMLQFSISGPCSPGKHFYVQYVRPSAPAVDTEFGTLFNRAASSD